MDDTQAKRVIEALLFVFSQPLPLRRVTDLMPELEGANVRRIIHTLNAEYDAGQRAFRIQEVAGGYQLLTDQEFAPWIRRALQTPKPDSVSAATMETLAIIAYRQPLTKAEVEAVRGVDVTASLDTLVERKFIRVVGRKDSPGRPFLYGTTTEFLRHFGLKSLEALPRMHQPSIPEPTAAEPAPSPATPAHPAESAAQASEPAAADTATATAVESSSGETVEPHAPTETMSSTAEAHGSS